MASSPKQEDPDHPMGPYGYSHHQHYFTAPSFSSLFNVVSSRQNIMHDANQDEDPLETTVLRTRVHRPSLSASINRGLGLGFCSNRTSREPLRWIFAIGRKHGVKLAKMRSALTLILTPVLLSPLLLCRRAELRCAFCVLLMAVYWMR